MDGSIRSLPCEKQGNRSKWKRLLRAVYVHRYIYLLISPGFLYIILFKIVPIWGLSLAFVDYNPMVGLLKSEWVGLRFFRRCSKTGISSSCSGTPSSST